MPRPPVAREMTVGEKRALSTERASLPATVLVALVAAAASFSALIWCGRLMGMAHMAFALPVAIDGLGIMCALGVARHGGSFRSAFSEWFGLGMSVTLSIAGNVAHALQVLPAELKVAFAASMPVIVAYGVHVYCRAIASGVSTRVFASDPTQIQLALDTATPAKSDTAPVPARRPVSRPPLAATTVARPERSRDRSRDRGQVTREPAAAIALEEATATGSTLAARLGVRATGEDVERFLTEWLKDYERDGAAPAAAAVHAAVFGDGPSPAMVTTRKWARAAKESMSAQMAGPAVALVRDGDDSSAA